MTAARARRFRDRRAAGRELAARLEVLREEHPVVLALPRGGVPVAFEVARALRAPLDVMVVRKLGLPSRPELGMGAIGEGGVRVLDPHVIQVGRVTPDDIATVEAREQAELRGRIRRFRGDRPMIPLTGRTVIVVDDGVATGGTARAALQFARSHGARRVVLAVPVAPPDTVRALAGEADTVVAVETPSPMYAIGEWYEDFTQTTDDEVRELLGAAARDVPVPALRFDADVAIGSSAFPTAGRLTVPTDARGVVLFAPGSGSAPRSRSHELVAGHLHVVGLATLRLDLLSEEEAREWANVFDVELLAVRLLAATRWVRAHAACAGLPVGYFGVSTGAGAALWAAAEDPTVAAVVSCGGRPDLATARLPAVQAPTLLVVGGADATVLRLNEEAARHLPCEHRLVVVPGATHRFEEPGALAVVAGHAASWFVDHLAAVSTSH